jgi:hypothetical protein
MSKIISEFVDEKAQKVYFVDPTCHLPDDSSKQKYTHLTRCSLFSGAHFIVDRISLLSFQLTHAFHEEIQENPTKA